MSPPTIRISDCVSAPSYARSPRDFTWKKTADGDWALWCVGHPKSILHVVRDKRYPERHVAHQTP
jgi:hypothetical protein